MLIVNADDLGRNRLATDRILACYARRRITSASAMVHMADSARAASLAAAAGLETGLHINFSEAFSGPAVPEGLRRDQEVLQRFLRRSKYSLVVFQPLLSDRFRSVYQAQAEEYLRLYGRTPAHFDGHQHLHLATNVLLQRLIPPGTRTRRSFTFAAGERNLFNRAYRVAVDGLLARRHLLTDSFFSITHYFSPERLEPILRRARSEDVELMVHPEIDREFEFLMSESFAAAIAGVALGRHADRANSIPVNGGP